MVAGETGFEVISIRRQEAGGRRVFLA